MNCSCLLFLFNIKLIFNPVSSCFFRSIAIAAFQLNILQISAAGWYLHNILKRTRLFQPSSSHKTFVICSALSQPLSKSCMNEIILLHHHGRFVWPTCPTKNTQKVSETNCVSSACNVPGAFCRLSI